MTIIRNELRNPSAELGTSGWEAALGTLTNPSTGTTWPAAKGTRMLLATASGTGTLLYVRTPLAAVDRYPVGAGQWVGARVWFATDTGMYAVARLLFYDAAGALTGSISSAAGYVPGLFYAGGSSEVVAQAPAGSTSYRVEVNAYANTWNTTVPAGARLWVDRAQAHRSWYLADVEAGLAAGYHDGDDVGWAWEGLPHASASRGIAELYEPDAVLLRAGVVVDYLDLVPGLRESAPGRSLVQLPLGDPTLEPTVTIRATRERRGELRAHLTTETGYGKPGARAEALLASLATGQPHTLRMLHDEPGVAGDLVLVPQDDATREKAPREGVWTVSTGYSRTASA